MISIIDYKLGNLFSIKNFFLNLSYKINVTSDPKKISKSKVIILPGVGAFGEAMKNIKKLKLDKELKKLSQDKSKIFIGICLGFQLMFDESTEYKKTSGLSIFPGKVVHMENKVKKAPVPHTGWNTLRFNNINQNSFLKKILNKNSYYFVHSFYVKPINKKSVMTFTNYNNLNFASSISKGNIYGFQFHPEKSGINGIKLIKQILERHEI